MAGGREGLGLKRGVGSGSLQSLPRAGWPGGADEQSSSVMKRETIQVGCGQAAIGPKYGKELSWIFKIFGNL